MYYEIDCLSNDKTTKDKSNQNSLIKYFYNNFVTYIIIIIILVKSTNQFLH